MSDRSLPSSFDENSDFYNESGIQKVFRKIKEEPLIPVGCGLTVAAFTGAYRAMRRGDHQRVQMMFRARVAAQAFTVVAMVAGGIYFQEDRKKTKELRELKAQQEAEEKRIRWIKELEIRDQEEKALREKLDKRRKKAAERGVVSEGSLDGVTAQAKAALQDHQDTAQEAAAQEKNSGSGVLGSLGGLFGRSNSKTENADEQTKSVKPDDEKTNP
ncbi:Hypoxia induced protein conserved region domain containing protein [Rhypophila decipiens]